MNQAKDDADLNSPASTSEDELDSQVQRAHEQLLQLRQQQEFIERQKRELEELSRRQEEFEHGRYEVTEKLTRALVILEREFYEAQKRVEQLNKTRESFEHHLSLLDGINPAKWNKTDLHKELSRSLSAVDDAIDEYNKSRIRLNADGHEEVISEGTKPHYLKDYNFELEKSFAYWFKAGFAFMLPLMLLLAGGLGIFFYFLFWVLARV